MDDEIRNTPSSVTLEYSRGLMGREWPWHTSGALAGACMAVAQQAPSGVRVQDQKKTTGVPSRSGSERLARTRAWRLRAGVSAIAGRVNPERTSYERASR